MVVKLEAGLCHLSLPLHAGDHFRPIDLCRLTFAGLRQQVMIRQKSCSGMLYPLIDRPSRITTHSCTLIDNIFTNQINYSIRSGLLMNDITDHLPIFALCNYEIENKKSDPVKYVRNLKNENVSLLIESLSQELWNNVLQSDDVNVAYMNFIEKFSKLYNLHCPVKKAHAKGIKSRGLQMDLKMRVVRKMVFTGHFFGREPTLQNTGIKSTKIN